MTWAYKRTEPELWTVGYYDYTPDDVVQRLVTFALAWRAWPQEHTHPGARTELVLWRGHLAAELARLRLTLAELGCLADLISGTIADDSIAVGRVSALAAEIIDGLRGDPGAYGAKWGIDERALEDAVLDLGPTATHALRDAVARWWETNAEHTPAGWSTVGITVKEPL